MAEETVTILRVDTGQAVASIRDLKDNISALKSQLSGLTIGTEEYQKTLQQLNVNQNAVRAAMNATTASMDDLTKAANGTGESYNALVNRMAAMRKELRNIDVSTETGQKQFKELSAQILSVNTQLKEMDAATGNYQRNVGNYEGAVRGLNLAMAQVVRELPSLSMGADMFFLAISNNLPILMDNIQMLREQNAKLLAETGKAPNLFRQVVRSLFSWNSLMSVGITLLTLFGGKIIDWVSGLFKAKEETDAAAKAQEELNKAMADMAQAEVKATASAKTYYSIATDVTRSMEDRLGAAQKLIREYPQYLSDFSEEEIIAGKAADAYGRLSLSIQEAARAKAAMQKITENYSKIFELQNQITEKETENVENAVRLSFRERERESKGFLSRLGRSFGRNILQMNLGIDYDIQELKNSIQDNDEAIKDFNAQIAALESANQSLQGKISLTSEYFENEAEAIKKAADELERLKAAADKAVKWEFEGLQDPTDVSVDDSAGWDTQQTLFDNQMERLETFRQQKLRWNELMTGDERARLENEYLINEEYNQKKLDDLLKRSEEAYASGDMAGGYEAEQEAADLAVQIEQDKWERINALREYDLQKEREHWQTVGKLAQAGLGAISDILGGIADAMESNGELTAREQQRVKNIRIAGAVIDILSGVTTAIARAYELGPIAGPIVGALQSAAIIATGVAQINKIKQTDVSGNSSSSGSISAPAAVQAPTISPQFNQVRNITGASEEERLNRMAGDQRVYVLESDIEAARNSRRVKVEESTF